MARTKSDDSPVVTVKVERGKLVPVSAYDAELLDRWREGAVLNVDPVVAIVRPLEKRYFAMLSTLLKEADTDWTNTDTAHEALKLATGFIVPLKKKDGGWGKRSRHISSFTDVELSEFFELFCGIVKQRFGIDPDALQRSSPDIGLESSGPPSAVEADDGPSAPSYPDVSAGVPNTELPSTEASVEGAPEAGGTLESNPRELPPARGLTPEELDWLKLVARMLVSATEPDGDVGIVDRQVAAIKKNLTPPDIRRTAKDLAQLIYRHCRAVTVGDEKLDTKWVASTANCHINDLRPEAR